MWTALTLSLAMSCASGQTGTLALTNARSTHGDLGPVRSGTKILPGDRFTLSFDVEGIKLGKDGHVRYEMGMEVTDVRGTAIYSVSPRSYEAYYFLGGSRMHLSTVFLPGFDQKPGEYKMAVTVKDKTSNAVAKLAKSFEILPKSFGVADLRVSYDPDGRVPAPSRGIPGQTLTYQFNLVAFERDMMTRQPNLRVEMRVLDENGKNTVEKPLAQVINQEVLREIEVLPLSFVLLLNRPGKFTVELMATDRVSKKTHKITFPLVVSDDRGESLESASP